MDRRGFLAGVSAIGGASVLMSSVATSAQANTPVVASRVAMQELLGNIDQLQKIDKAKIDWNTFCEALAQTGTLALDRLHAETDLDLAEGIRYLSRISRLALESEMENQDNLHPYLQRALGPTLKMGGDNPRGLYLKAPINGTDTFRLSGHLGSAAWLSFLSQRSYDALSEGLTVFGDSLFSTNLRCDENNYFEILIAPGVEGENTISTDKFSKILMIRQFFDATVPVKPMDLRIENLTRREEKKPLLTLDCVSERLRNSTAFFQMMIPIMQDEMIEHASRLNIFETDEGNPTSNSGGVPGGGAVTARWKLRADEALVLTVHPPEICPYWDVQVGNVWYESFDYRHFISGFTADDAVINSDNSVTIVLSEQDPGIANWLQTAGHEEGHIAIRWQLSEGQLPIPSCTVVKISEIKRYTSLPDVSKADRKEQVQSMREAVEQRFRL